MTADQYAPTFPVLSIVVPVYNEEAVLPLFYRRLRAVLDTLGSSFEIVFIDDGSKDSSIRYLASLAYSVSNVRLVCLSRNFGKEAAMTAGLDDARGAAVILIDADLQDPPELIPAMVAAWRKGSDVVALKRRTRAGESWLKRFYAYVFYRLLSRLSGVAIPEDTGDFRLLSRKAVIALGRLRERNRYMKGLFAWIGLPTEVMLYDRDPRAAGQSKWGFIGLMRLAFEAVTSFSVAPLRLVATVGLFVALGSAGFGSWIVLKTLLFGEPISGYPSIITMVTFLGGIQLLSIGLVGEYIGKIYMEAKRRPLYLIDRVCELPSLGLTTKQSQRDQNHAAP